MSDPEYNQYAPAYTIPDRKLGAVEHPMIIKDVDKGVRSFGHAPDFHTMLSSESPQISVPLYLRQDNPTTRPLLSYNASSHNVVLKVTVPKRTGRKRKRGTDEAFEAAEQATSTAPAAEQATSTAPATEQTTSTAPAAEQTTSTAPATEQTTSTAPATEQVCSYAKLDAPKLLKRKLVDTVGQYSVEAVGIIKHTHRYRGYTDFQWSFGNSSHMQTVVSSLVPGHVSKLREFDLRPGTDNSKRTEILPPPGFTSHGLSFPYNYTQNIYTKENPKACARSVMRDSESEQSEDEFNRVVNVTSYHKSHGAIINFREYPVPTGPQRKPNMKNPEVAAIVTEFRRMMEDRPVWTRRALVNRFNEKFGPGFAPLQVLKQCVQFVGYQFKGGPWRDGIVRYGCDPRTDASYRKYQTVVFKLSKTRVGSHGKSWQYVRRNEVGLQSTPKTYGPRDDARESHLFDGRSFTTDSKVWQVCDITDPPLARLLAKAQMQPECSEKCGYYHPVVLTGVKLIMRLKLLAIRFNRNLSRWDWDNLVDGYLHAEAKGFSENTEVVLPNLRLTPQEYEQITGRLVKPGISTGRKPNKGILAKRQRLKIREHLSEQERVTRIAKRAELHRRRADEDDDLPGAVTGVSGGASSRKPQTGGHDEGAVTGVAGHKLAAEGVDEGGEDEGDEDDGDEGGDGNAGQQELLDFLAQEDDDDGSGENSDDDDDDSGSDGDDSLGEEEDDMGEDGTESARVQNSRARRLSHGAEHAREDQDGASEEDYSSDDYSDDHQYGFDVDGYDDAMDDHENEFNGYDEGEFYEDDYGEVDGYEEAMDGYDEGLEPEE